MTREPAEPSGIAAPVRYRDLSPAAKRERLRELALLFLKLGTISFGGPAAHIAMMNEEVVKRRQWVDQQTFLDLLGATNLIPGPNSTELAIHIGYERAGWRGLIVAGACFILPAMLAVWTLAAVYARYRTVPEIGWLLYGVKPVIIAIVLQALWGLGKSAIKNVPTGVAAVLVISLSLVGLHEILLLFLAGLAVMVVTSWRAIVTRTGVGSWVIPIPGLLTQAAIAPLAAYDPTLPRVFGFFLKIGSILYGSGYVLLAFLQKDLVDRWHWLSSQELLDAVAIGQFTPGPVFTTATFIGYLLAGNAGAIVATLGIFLPSFVFVAAINPWVPKLRRSPWAAGFLDGINAASLALMAVVTWTLARAALIDPLTVAIALVSLVALFRFRVNSAWLILAGGALGALSRALL
ncbi:chromate efflux transporter [Caldinitratiruptor microaerophilus]|uniref:Chromate transporter n=1 Tax=Caldinitratiruptor microaerophilus TaxID=671077 RepID=A0AA35CPG2_9FIRM|nr:chromate efflux transporter [Caldinitratiruptor microaerophilus]BDG61572.1 chromate transporter [Caldinitratiruptor microaerophilus]